MKKFIIPGSILEKQVTYVKIKVPDQIKIKKNPFLSTKERVHYGIYADKSFKKGEILWVGYCNIVQHRNLSKFDFIFDIDLIGLIQVSVYDHMMIYANFIFYEGFGCLTNHSCNPNAFSITNFNNSFDKIPSKCFYDFVASKDIKVGEEITCNYLLFFEGSENKEGFICRCGSKKCYKEIRGFKNLSIEQQDNILPLVHPYLREKWRLFRTN